MKKIFLIFILDLLFSSSVFAANPVVNLNVTYKTVNFTGSHAQAIVVNDSLPGPVLHFKEGDHVSINVYNHLDKGTAIHWHGLLVPWRMDGVEHVTQLPIPPGGVFHYQYTLKQSGTYWYHAHADLQEQQGLYGAIIIDPLKPDPYRYNKDFVMMLSDWSNSDPDHIFANLKKSGDFYSPNFPLQPSLVHFIESYKKDSPAQRQQLKDAYEAMQVSRMSPYDLSDVAYDAFLLNGHSLLSPWKAYVKVGDTVRLRFINAGASTQFNVKIPGTSMRVVNVDGNNVRPYAVDTLALDAAETWDVLVTIKENKPYIIYAESNDKRGKVYGALLTQPQQSVNFSSVTPFPEPAPMSMAGMNMSDMSDMSMASMPGMDMSGMNMSGMDMSAMDMPEPASNKYQNIVAPQKTNDPNAPVQIINMELNGYMGQYIWFLNGLPEYKAKPILIVPGKRYRFVFKNDSMMYHPMHLHGHWMILRNGHGAYDPKVHTISVPPGETMTADFYADSKDGFWYFHCHKVFHMRAGMADLVQYDNTPASDLPMYKMQMDHSQQITAHPARWYRSTYIEAAGDPFDSFYQLTFNALLGPDYNKLQLHTEDAEIQHGTVEDADMDIFYWHLLGQFWAIKGGANYFVRPALKPFWQPGLGIEGLMPFFIDTNIRTYYYSGSFKLDLIFSRDTQITNNFFIRAGIRSILASKTVMQAQLGNGLNQMRYTLTPYYRVAPGVNIYMEYEHQQNFGASLAIYRNDGIDTSSNTLTLGLALLF